MGSTRVYLAPSCVCALFVSGARKYGVKFSRSSAHIGGDDVRLSGRHRHARVVLALCTRICEHLI